MFWVSQHGPTELNYTQGVFVLYSQEYVHAQAKVAGVITMQGSCMGAT